MARVGTNGSLQIRISSTSAANPLYHDGFEVVGDEVGQRERPHKMDQDEVEDKKALFEALYVLDEEESNRRRTSSHNGRPSKECVSRKRSSSKHIQRRTTGGGASASASVRPTTGLNLARSKSLPEPVISVSPPQRTERRTITAFTHDVRTKEDDQRTSLTSRRTSVLPVRISGAQPIASSTVPPRSKRKRAASIKLKPEAQQLFKGLSFCEFAVVIVDVN